MLVSASVCSIGIIRSSTGPSKRDMNAAETRCGPAETCTTGEVMLSPFGSCSFIRGLMSMSATRSPLMAMSICSPL
jgi:hypothetical protein